MIDLVIQVTTPLPLLRAAGCTKRSFPSRAGAAVGGEAGTLANFWIWVSVVVMMIPVLSVVVVRLARRRCASLCSGGVGGLTRCCRRALRVRLLRYPVGVLLVRRSWR